MLSPCEIHYLYFETLESTNTWVKEHALSLDPRQITCVVASEQTAGRGRWNRKWLSCKGNNLYATLYFCLPQPSIYIGNLGQILSLACVQVLQMLSLCPRIKWPNDIFIGGKKIAGILCETMQQDDLLGVALGIGLNVDTPRSLLDTLDQPATSLQEATGKSWKREELLYPIMEQFVSYLRQLQTEGFTSFLVRYQELLTFLQPKITCRLGDALLSGVYDSINDRGELILRLDGGQQVTLSSGEIDPFRAK